MANIFIDGEAGTTGLQIRERLAGKTGINLLSIDPLKRKDPEVKKLIMQNANIVILCLHDDAAKESVAMIDSLPGKKPKIIDASTAHRIAPGWVYGFPELSASQLEAVKAADRVSNPGCYATGAIAILRPLIDAGLLPKDFAASLPSISGYSGGGRVMMEAYEKGQAPAYETYALGLNHKHIPEILANTGLTRRPLFIPAVANFDQGMLVQLPIHLDLLPRPVKVADLEQALRAHYAGSQWVTVESATENGKLDAVALKNTNKLELRVYGSDEFGHAVVIARLDNLGKGASGAAVQNLELMLGQTF